ncbi:polyphosphate polymerase domain-containing protein [Chakrabartyella piscis]|uniref:polyphosphate polymerase domain-containing protein n=1 Tax=Chakrabartyella piscis TaxID=2918914 RepID=UPI002958AF14|nr:polyphosphate polymerase domain-containing protein [Chakrabartyella piscis]
MSTTMVFKRYELKYLLTEDQYRELQQVMAEHMQIDEYGKNTIRNIYFDTPDFLLIRRSIERPCYKEKLRVRSYGNFNENSNVFVEMKKKYEGVVYKRRLTLSQKEAFGFLVDHTPLAEETQIAKELAYFMEHYGSLQPAIALHYEREAYFGLEDHDFRMTFDQDIRINTDNISLGNKGVFTPILNPNMVLLEVKTGMGIPAWLLSFFSEHKIYKTSFSKYGTAYQKFVLPKMKGGSHNVA